MTWAIAMVRSPEELSLASQLRRDGQTVYLPVTERKISVRGRMTKRFVAAWPGYLFIRDPLPIDDSRLYGFLIKADWERETLSDDAIEGFRLMERLGVFQTHAESERQLGIGEAVRVSSRLLGDKRGTIEAPLRGKDGYVLIGGGDFPNSVWIASALIKPDITVQ